jgi:NADH-quinone oxidoreductase subunit N
LDGIPPATAPLLVALLLTVAATLILGIVPGRVLALAKAGANTLSPSAPESSANTAAANPQ